MGSRVREWVRPQFWKDCATSFSSSVSATEAETAEDSSARIFTRTPPRWRNHCGRYPRRRRRCARSCDSARQHVRRVLAPFDQHDAAAVQIFVKPDLEQRFAVQNAVQVKMRHTAGGRVVFVGDRKGRAGHAALVAQAAQHAARKRGFARPQIARKRDHVARVQRFGICRAEGFGLLRGVGGIFHSNTFSYQFDYQSIIPRRGANSKVHTVRRCAPCSLQYEYISRRRIASLCRIWYTELKRAGGDEK